MSFDPNRMICVTCPDQHVLLKNGINGPPVCVVMSDQNFSPFGPASRDELCMLVITAEDDLLSDLESILHDVFRNFSKPLGALPAGSVVLL